MVVSCHHKAWNNHNFLLLINSLKMRQSSNMLEQQKRIKLTFTKKRRAAYIREMPAAVLFSISASRLLTMNFPIKIYEAVTLPIVLYVCESWSLTPKEKHRSRMFVIRVLKIVFGPK
jgi:uncharacterized membrane protein YhhN